MRKNILGNTKIKVSQLGIGLSEIGSELSINDDRKASELLNFSLDNGINFLDTASCYGVSEELIGKTVSHRRHEYYIASTDLEYYPKSEPHKAWTGSLGVLRQYRRKGIATALKIKAMEKLLQKGITEIRTDNEENNPMYKINEKLGFKPVPSSMDYSKKI